MDSPIPTDVQLVPGDLVHISYRIVTTNQTRMAWAIADVKEKVASDPRWHYQGSEIEERLDPATGESARFLNITVQIADPSKVTGNHPTPPEVQLAGIGPGTVLLLSVILGFFVGVVIVGALEFNGYDVTLKRPFEGFKWGLITVLVILVLSSGVLKR